MQYGLSDYTLATLEGIFSKYQSIKEVILYGSRAMGNYKNGSDIDKSTFAYREVRKGVVFLLWIALLKSRKFFYIIHIMESSKKKVYIETTIPSLITARLSGEIGVLFRQQKAMEFWENERHKYDLYVSLYVIEECAKGDEKAAKRRLELIKDIPQIPKSKETDELAEEYFEFLQIPQKAKTDCSHLAICVINKIDFLLSWNLTHLGDSAYQKTHEYNIRRNLWTPDLLDPDTFMRKMKLEEAENG